MNLPSTTSRGPLPLCPDPKKGRPRRCSGVQEISTGLAANAARLALSADAGGPLARATALEKPKTKRAHAKQRHRGRLRHRNRVRLECRGEVGGATSRQQAVAGAEYFLVRQQAAAMRDGLGDVEAIADR